MDYRKRKTRSGLRRAADIVFTLCLLGGVAYAVVWLDRHNTDILEGRALVGDGDSLDFDASRVRLVGIDAPELDQFCDVTGGRWPCGKESRNALRKMIGRRDVRCESGSVDEYDRWLATCFVSNVNINKWLVLNGWALSYGDYQQEEREAEKNRAGVWRGDFERPREWRDAQRGDATGGKLLD